MKKIISFSFEIDNNLQEWYDKYNLKTFVVSPYQTRKSVITYDDGSIEENTDIIDRTIIFEEAKK